MKSLKFLFIVSLLSTGLFVACDDDDDNPDPALTTMDRTFMEKAAYGNKAEIEAGQLASTKGNDTMVKMFGTMMVQDHTTAYDELEDLSDDWDVVIPQTPDSVHQAMKQYLNTLSGYTFDTAYINAQVKDHQQTVALFQLEADSSKQLQLKAYATKYLPKIKMHLQKADSIANALRN